jgi:TPR repeat protein
MAAAGNGTGRRRMGVVTVPVDRGSSRRDRGAIGTAKMLRRVAEGGDAAAQFNIGMLCASAVDDNGYAVPGDRAEALRWLLLAAQAGLPRAQLKLAELYSDSRPASGDRVLACAWLLVAISRLTGAQRAIAETGYRTLAAQLSAGRMLRARNLAARLAAGSGSNSAGV